MDETWSVTRTPVVLRLAGVGESTQTTLSGRRHAERTRVRTITQSLYAFWDRNEMSSEKIPNTNVVWCDSPLQRKVLFHARTNKGRCFYHLMGSGNTVGFVSGDVRTVGCPGRDNGVRRALRSPYLRSVRWKTRYSETGLSECRRRS